MKFFLKNESPLWIPSLVFQSQTWNSRYLLWNSMSHKLRRADYVRDPNFDGDYEGRIIIGSDYSNEMIE